MTGEPAFLEPGGCSLSPPGRVSPRLPKIGVFWHKNRLLHRAKLRFLGKDPSIRSGKRLSLYL